MKIKQVAEKLGLVTLAQGDLQEATGGYVSDLNTFVLAGKPYTLVR